MAAAPAAQLIHYLQPGGVKCNIAALAGYDIKRWPPFNVGILALAIREALTDASAFVPLCAATVKPWPSVFVLELA